MFITISLFKFLEANNSISQSNQQPNSPEIKTVSKSSDTESRHDLKRLSTRKRKSPHAHNEMKQKKYRNYRARNDSEEESDNENEAVKKEHLTSNLDADSDFSIDSSDSEEENASKDKKIESEEKRIQDPLKASADDKKIDNIVEAPQDETSKEQPKKEHLKVKKPKVDIWKKRTVGEKYDEAVKRYFERKAQREMGL